MENQKVIEEKVYNAVQKIGVKAIKSLLQDEKKKWKEEVMKELKDETLPPYLKWIEKTKDYGGSQEEYHRLKSILNNRNQFLQELRVKLKGV